MSERRSGYLPIEIAQVTMRDIDRGFFEAARRHELTIQRCSNCGAYQHPPRVACARCRSFDLSWAPVRPTGTVFTYTIVRHPIGILADYVPFVVIVVELDDADVRLVSNLVDDQGENVHIGLRVEVAWDDLSEELTIPRFRPIAQSGAEVSV